MDHTVLARANPPIRPQDFHRVPTMGYQAFDELYMGDEQTRKASSLLSLKKKGKEATRYYF